MDDIIEIDAPREKMISNPFVFSRPNTITDSPRVVSFGVGSDHVFDVHSNKKDVFTFSAPTIISKYDETYVTSQAGNHGRFKPKIPRVVYKPTLNVFASALKDTGAFEQLKKNSRSRIAKLNIENSITCFNVPKNLLNKSAAKEYFTKYGNIVKITIRPKRHIIVVTYTSKEEANVAYYSSTDYMGEKFHVEWSKSESSLKSPTKRKNLHQNIVENLLKASDDEIKSELEALANLEYNLHSNKGPGIASMSLPMKMRIPGGKMTSHEKPMPKVEKPVPKVEKLETEGPVIKPLPNTSLEDLQNIIHQVVLTVEDKYKVLEARDRLMRLKRVKPASLATAKVTSGTCPDMCPEKERLMRESQRQVALYEQLEGNEYRINHVTAIKQYSRSSADQEEPMPHELRPVRVLKMTMSYLLHEIVDLCEQEGTNLAEWYHFLWDRTRGIRKDITQQELCCADSVELIEQCARFHIVCSERLCAEDASVFDKKINSENLTKCLQTLKYMYHDLRMKGITCKNEPEFRSYVVLLNLNNGNFLYDLQQLPKPVQNSPEVQFAISVYFALDSNNYYKFFKMVRQTTYLNACILLRYFNQIRVKALSVMVKAYCRRSSTAFPLYELMDILGFEDENETRYFCEQVGLNLSSDELHVLLNRENFTMPAANVQKGRACNLIESKRIALNFSIGQSIAGGQMPSKTYRNHKPHNSFDAHGNLLPESVNAADQSPAVTPLAETSPRGYAEKEIRRMPKLTSIHREKGQAAQIKRQQPIGTTANESSQSRKFASALPELNGSNIFKTTTFEAEVSTGGHRRTMPNVFENKSQLMQLKGVPDKQAAGNEVFAATTGREDTIDKIRQPTIFGGSNALNNPFASNNPVVGLFPKQSAEAPANTELATPFATAVSKSIFSGTGSGNVFARSVASASTMFVDDRLSVSAQQLPASKVTVEPDTSKREHPHDKAPTTISTTEARARMEHENETRRRLEERCEEIYGDLHTEVVREFCSAIAREEIDRIKMYEALSERIASDTIDEVVRGICDAVVTAEIDSQRKLQAVLLRSKNRVITRCFNAWRRYTLKRRRQREALEDTPVWLQRRSVEECARMLYTKEQDTVIRNMRERRSCEHSTTEDRSADSLAPIELVIYNGIRENSRSLDTVPSLDVFWKLVISWPNLTNRAAMWYHKKTVNGYLYPDDLTMDPIVKIYRPNQHETLRVCIRHFEGFISERNLIGADALLFIVDASEEYKFVSRRLTRTVLSRHKLMPVPLAFIVLGDGDLESQNERIVADLESFLESGYVSEYTIMFEKNLTSRIILNLTQSAILWLTVNRSPASPLEMDYLHNIYDVCLSEELWLRILSDSSYNKQLSRALEDPNFIIDLHNEAVSHLTDIILDPESMLYTNFAPEFKKFLRISHSMPCGYEYFDESWKRDEYRAKLESEMNSFLLPQWNAPWPITEVKDLRHIMNYCRKVLSDSNYCDTVFYDIANDFSLIPNTLQTLNFIRVLLNVIKEKVRLLDEDQTVIYNKNHIKHFRTLPWWFRSNVLMEFISHELTPSNNDTSYESSRKRRRLDESENDLDASSLDEDFGSLAEFCENTHDQVMKVHFSSKEIENRLQVQQSRNVLFEERLKNALLDEVH